MINCDTEEKSKGGCEIASIAQDDNFFGACPTSHFLSQMTYQPIDSLFQYNLVPVSVLIIVQVVLSVRITSVTRHNRAEMRSRHCPFALSALKSYALYSFLHLRVCPLYHGSCPLKDHDRKLCF